MGRYYNGDVNGKFMFAVQGSDARDLVQSNKNQTT